MLLGNNWIRRRQVGRRSFSLPQPPETIRVHALFLRHQSELIETFTDPFLSLRRGNHTRQNYRPVNSSIDGSCHFTHDWISENRPVFPLPAFWSSCVCAPLKRAWGGLLINCVTVFSLPEGIIHERNCVYWGMYCDINNRNALSVYLGSSYSLGPLIIAPLRLSLQCSNVSLVPTAWRMFER